MISQLLLATGNPGKARELRAALADLPLEIISLDALPPEQRDVPPPDESGTTFAENAAIKATYWRDITGLPTLADDAGLIVDALPGELGVATRRWGAGEHATDEEWLVHFLERMRDVPAAERGAEFVSVLALALPTTPIPPPNPLPAGGGDVVFFEGRVRGIIADRPLAPILPGIPLSSVFIADGSDTVFSAMTEAEKNAASHRGRALNVFKSYISNLLHSGTAL